MTPAGTESPAGANQWVAKDGAGEAGSRVRRPARWISTRIEDAGSTDRGSATVEFVTVGVLLLVPLVYLVLAMSRVQAASFAADSSARAAARAYVTAPDEDAGRRRAEIAVDLGLRDQGFGDRRDREVSLTCDVPSCLTPGAEVRIGVVVRVVLPGVPRFLGRALSAEVTVRSDQAAVVDEFRPVAGSADPGPEAGTP